jgi:hypothetical protein
MKKGLVFVLALVMCEFVVGGAYSEIETSFVIKGSDVVGGDLEFWGEYGDSLIAGGIMLAVVIIYLVAITVNPKKKRRK